MCLRIPQTPLFVFTENTLSLSYYHLDNILNQVTLINTPVCEEKADLLVNDVGHVAIPVLLNLHSAGFWA